jgi:putative peptidoglycan lipid II flippase
MVGSLIAVSRFLGFWRDLAIAALLGTSFAAEAFFVAQRLPNLFRAVFAEGAFNNSFVPVFTAKLHHEGTAKSFEFAREVLSALLYYLAAFCVLAVVAMPWAIVLIAPGFTGKAEQYDLAVELTQICFPYLLLISVTSLFAAVLNSMKRFAASMLAPALMNAVLICACLYAWWQGYGDTPQSARVLSYAVLLGGIAQLAIVAFSARRLGVPLLPGMPRLTGQVAGLARAALPVLIAGGVTQINFLVAMAFVSDTQGGIAYLYYAEKIVDLPWSIIGMALALVLLPELTRALQQPAGATQAIILQNRALEMSAILSIPAALALVVIGEPIARTIFEHGAFGPADTSSVAPVLTALALGLPAFIAVKLLQLTFYARQNTKIPMYCAIASAAINLAACLLLQRAYSYIGIAMAISLAAWANVILLYLVAQSRGVVRLDIRFAHNVMKAIACALVMSLAIWFFKERIVAQWVASGAGVLYQIAGLTILVGVGFALYIMLISLWRAVNWDELRASAKLET